MAKLTFVPRRADQVRRSQANNRNESDSEDDGRGDESQQQRAAAAAAASHQLAPHNQAARRVAILDGASAQISRHSNVGPSPSTEQGDARAGPENASVQQALPSAVPAIPVSIGSSAHGPLPSAPVASTSATTTEQQQRLHEFPFDIAQNGYADDRAPPRRIIVNQEELQPKIDKLYKVTQQADAVLDSNAQYQNEILGVMKRYAAAQERLDELEILLDEVLDELTIEPEHKIVVRDMVSVSTPWFRSQFGKNLPPSKDAMIRQLHIRLTDSVPMTMNERHIIKKQVKESNQRALAAQAQQSQVENAALKAAVELTATFCYRGESITRKLSAAGNAYLLNSTENLDWDRIASFVPGRSATECRIQWLQHDHPLVNRKRTWSRKESDDLDRVAREHNHRDWQAIANALGTNRTAADCLRQYRRKRGNKQVWTKEQDELLVQAINIYGEQWKSVALFVGGKDSSQCLNRWTKTVRPHKRGRWSAEEDEILRQAVRKLGQKWSAVHKLVPGRTDAQCRERYCNHLDPNVIKFEEWTPEEDEYILELRDKDNRSWSEISAAFKGTRTDQMISVRYLALKKQEMSFKGRGKYKRKGISTKTQVANRIKLQTDKARKARATNAKGEAEKKSGSNQRAAEPSQQDDEREEVGDEAEMRARAVQGGSSGAGTADYDHSDSGQSPQPERALTRGRKRDSATAQDQSQHSAATRVNGGRPTAAADGGQQRQKRARIDVAATTSETLACPAPAAMGVVGSSSTSIDSPAASAAADAGPTDMNNTVTQDAPQIPSAPEKDKDSSGPDKDDEVDDDSAAAEINQSSSEQDQLGSKTDSAPVKRGRGRPRKNPLPEENGEPVPKRPRGRPRKYPIGQEPVKEKRPRGRPRKYPVGQEPVKEKRPRGRPRKNPLPEQQNEQQQTSTGEKGREHGEGTSEGQ
ncbi:hypothetical protein OIV83_001025 [Microbotryomycetes sp. JL201]|nr:hypothetical protein OIV83_001025 [Microbotryomycetes sp. JL201]